MRRYLGSIFAAAAVLGLTALIWRALVAPAPARLGLNTAAADVSPGLELSNTTLVVWDHGRAGGTKLCQINAQHIRISRDKRLTSFVGISDGTLFRDGRPQARLKAGSAVYDVGTNRLQVEGPIELSLADEETRLSTQRLSWQGASRVVELPDPAILQTTDCRLQAARARVDVQQATVRVEAVTGGWQGVDLGADTCLYDSRSHTLQLTPLRLRSGDWSLNAAQARIDPRTGELRAEHVHMTSSSTTLFSLARRGQRAGVRLASAGLAAGLLAGVASGAPSSSGKAEPDKPKWVQYDAGHVETHTNHGRTTIVMTENVTFTHLDTKDPTKKLILTADKVEATEQEDGSMIATATGHPRATDERSEVTGEKILLYLKTRRAVVEGSVKIVVRPKEKPDAPAEAAPVASTGTSPAQTPPQPRSLRDRVKGDVVITSKRAEYNYRTKNAVAEGNVVVTNRGRKLTTPKAGYTDQTETVALTGPVSGTDEQGQTFEHEGDMEVVVKEGAEAMQTVGKSHVHGRLLIKEDEDETDAASKGGDSAAKPSGESKGGAGKTAGAVTPAH